MPPNRQWLRAPPHRIHYRSAELQDSEFLAVLLPIALPLSRSKQIEAATTCGAMTCDSFCEHRPVACSTAHISPPKQPPVQTVRLPVSCCVAAVMAMASGCVSSGQWEERAQGRI